MPRPSFPKTLREFQAQFANEEACIDYLARSRWPEGFLCPRCGHDKAIAPVDPDYPHYNNHATLWIAPGRGQAALLPDKFYVLRELTLQEFAGIAAGDGNHSVNLS